MKNTSRIIEIKSAREGRSSSKKLNSILEEVRDLSMSHLKVSLRKLFDHSDDAFFELADNAGSNSEQSTYFDSMRELRLQRKKIALDFLKSVSRTFFLSGKEVSLDTDWSADLDLESVGLVENDELEEQVAMNAMYSRVRNRCGIELEHYQMRCNSLFHNREIQKQELPLGPESMIRGFVDACRSLTMGIRSRLVLYKLFERFVFNEIDSLYINCNKSLARQGVLPNLVAGRSSRSAYSNRIREHSEGLYHSASEQHSNSATDQAEFADNGAIFDSLCELLHSSTTLSGQQISTGASVSQALIPRDSLLNTFSSAQHDEGMISVSEVRNGLINFRTLLEQSSNHLLAGSDRLNQVDEDMINLVAMLFEFILDDHNIQIEMKALLARLQIPMLKVAIMDRSFFSKGGHPARKLLNAIASAAIGWQPKNEGVRDPLKAKIEEVVQHLLDDFENDVALFQTLLDDFKQFVSQEQRRSQLVEKRTCDAETGKAKSEQARSQVDAFLSDRIKKYVASNEELPLCVSRLLYEGWSQVMLFTHLKYGEESKKWGEVCVVVNTLLWTLYPTVESVGQSSDLLRKKLLQTIPGLIQELREGLDQTSFDGFTRDSLLKSLEREHLNSLQMLSPCRANPKPKNNIVVPDLCEPEYMPSSEEVTHFMQDIDDIELDYPKDKQDEASNRLPVTESIITSEEPSLFKGIQEPVIRIEREEILSSDLSGIAPIEQKNVDSPNDIVEEVQETEDRYFALIDAMAVGTWFEFVQETGEKVRCKLAALIKMTGKYIFVNRAGVKVFDRSRGDLVADMRRGGLTLLDDGMLFDRALESIIGNLRENRQNGQI